MQAGFAGAHGHPSRASTGFGFAAINAPPKPTTNGNANGDVSSFVSQMSTGSRPAAQPFGSSHTHGGNAQGDPIRHPLPAKPPPTPNSSTNDVNSFFSQMGSTSRTPARKPGHGHGAASGFNPPTAPAAMRANLIAARVAAGRGGGGVQGTTTYSPSSAQWRPNPFAPKLSTSLPEGWHK
jgi:hypothetical protein